MTTNACKEISQCAINCQRQLWPCTNASFGQPTQRAVVENPGVTSVTVKKYQRNTTFFWKRKSKRFQRCILYATCLRFFLLELIWDFYFVFKFAWLSWLLRMHSLFWSILLHTHNRLHLIVWIHPQAVVRVCNLWVINKRKYVGKLG